MRQNVILQYKIFPNPPAPLPFLLTNDDNCYGTVPTAEQLCHKERLESRDVTFTRGVRTADADIRGPESADFLADADGPRIRQTNTFADADHPRI